MTLGRHGGSATFAESADAYAATMAPSLRPVAERVVAAAELRPDERVIDLGTGTGTAAALANGQGRRVTGLDAAAGMLEIARRTHPEVEWVEASFDAIPFAGGTFDAALAVHALLFGADPVATLREWRRVTRPGGRLSLSVPGPSDAVPLAVLGAAFERHGISREADYPTRDDLAGWADAAGWTDIATDADPTTAIVLDDEGAFRRWLTVGARGRATAGWSPERREALVSDLLDAAPRDPAGRIRLPFGSLYLTARRTAP